MSTLEFNYLIGNHSGSLKSFAYNFTKNVEDAEDLLQDTLLKAIRYKDKLLAVSTWKDGSLKLLELFEEAKPGVLASLVADGQLPNELSKDPNRFFRSKALVGGVYFNSHASGNGLKRKLKRIAERVGVKESEYGFVFENDS